VNDVDTVLSEELHKPPHASGVDWPLEVEYFGRKATLAKQISEPPNSMRGSNGDNRVTALP
jgi:hypothetical protein